MAELTPTRGHVRLKTPLPGPKAAAIIERDREILSPSARRAYPFVIERAEGCLAWDVDGNAFIDFTSGVAVANTGHSHPRVIEAIQRQTERFLHMAGMDFYYEIQVELAERLSAVAPMAGETRIFLANSGAEAIEAALKLARWATGRPSTLAFMGAFHGRTMGALSLSSSKPVHRQGFAPFVPGVTHVPYPYHYRCPFGGGIHDCGLAAIEFIERQVFAHHVPPGEVAAVFVEPVQGEGGYVVPPPSFLPALRELCDRHGILLVVDEIQSGMGRTGRWWAVEHWDVEPDIVAVAKGLASGVPMGAIVARKELMTWGPSAHGNTFGGNPVACAAALATMDLLEEGLIENAARMGDYLLQRLNEMAARHPTMGDVRGRGLMIGVELVLDRGTKAEAPELRERVLDAAFRRGLLVFGCGRSTVRFMPPLILDQAIADEALGIFEEALSEAEGA